MIRPVMYIIANKGLGMSPGKLASQVAHAAVRSAVDHDAQIVGMWMRKGEMKIVLEARDNDHMHWAERYLADKGYHMWLVVDEGHTETLPLVPTAMASGILDKDDEAVRFAFETFKLYKDDPADFGIPETTKRRWFR